MGCVEILFEIAKVPNFFRRLENPHSSYLSPLILIKGRQIREENKKTMLSAAEKIIINSYVKDFYAALEEQRV